MDTPKEFKFNLQDKVRLILSEEVGTIEGRGEFTNSDNQYLVRYKAADGRLVEAWWTEAAITID